jgi:hypothetical protein
LAPSNPRGPLTGDAWTDEESTTAAMVCDVGALGCGPRGAPRSGYGSRFRGGTSAESAGGLRII